MTDLLALDLVSLALRYGKGSVSPVEVVDAALTAAEATNPTVNAFSLIDRDGARAAAKASEKRWRKGKPLSPLDGMPFTVKDNLLWAGKPTRRGSQTTDNAPAGESAPAVDRLLEAGAIPFAKTTLPEFGWKGLGDSPAHGATRNPWDTRMTTGGSSAGAAAAAALGIGALHLGTDGAGSIRIPGAFSGVFGLKPSYGRVPAAPASPLAIVSHVGPLARTVADAALMLTTIATPDPRDMVALVTPPQNYLAGLEIGIKGVRIAWSPRLGYVERLDPDVEEACRAALSGFEAAGAIVEDADPGFADPTDTLRTLWRAGAWAVLRAIPEARWGEVDPGFVSEAEAGRAISGADYIAAVTARYGLAATMAAFHTRYDLLVTPTLATTAFEVNRNTPADGRFGDDWLSWTPYSYPFNLTWQPAATVPCGLTAAGLPVGLQIVGPIHRDGAVLRAARAFETARPWAKLRGSHVRH